MIKLIEVTEDNWFEIADLSVKEDQRNYVAPAIGILARGYVYRDNPRRDSFKELYRYFCKSWRHRMHTGASVCAYDLWKAQLDQEIVGHGVFPGDV